MTDPDPSDQSPRVPLPPPVPHETAGRPPALPVYAQGVQYVAFPSSKRKSWGGWASIGWTILITAVAIFGGRILTAAVSVALPPYQGGRFLSALVEIFVPPLLMVIPPLFLIRYRRISLAKYLGFIGLKWKSTLLGLGLYLAFLGLQTTVFHFAQIEEGGMRLEGPALIIFAVVAIAIAPITEEILFRGFCFHGIVASKMGPITAVIVTSLLWALSHFQYPLLGIIAVFAFGLLLGTLRWKTGSLNLTILLHTINNACFIAFLAMEQGKHWR